MDKAPDSKYIFNIAIGIDPEKSGAYTIITNSGIGHVKGNFKSFSRRIKEFKKDLQRVELFLQESVIGLSYNIKYLAYLEKVWLFPNQSMKTQDMFIKSYGVWLGTLLTLGIPVKSIPPRTWKNKYGLSSDKKESVILASALARKRNDCTKIISGLKQQRRDTSKSVQDKAESYLLALLALKQLGE